MALYVTELLGTVAGKHIQPVNGQFSGASYSLSSASTAPFPSAGCQMIRVSADAGMLLNLISTSTGLALTSTNAYRIPPNAPAEFYAVSTDRRVTAQST